MRTCPSELASYGRWVPFAKRRCCAAAASQQARCCRCCRNPCPSSELLTQPHYMNPHGTLVHLVGLRLGLWGVRWIGGAVHCKCMADDPVSLHALGLRFELGPGLMALSQAAAVVQYRICMVPVPTEGSFVLSMLMVSSPRAPM